MVYDNDDHDDVTDVHRGKGRRVSLCLNTLLYARGV